jgi:spore coat protein A, manganese oxidase
MNRREFLFAGAAALGAIRHARAAVPGGTLNPMAVRKFDQPLVIPPAMPETTPGYYEIAVRQFRQNILPRPWPATTVWSYGSANHVGTFHYPAFTIEAQWNTPLRVNWMNQLIDSSGRSLPHLLAVDQTLHWANPPGGNAGRDSRPAFPAPGPYLGPVPIVTHVHGAHSRQESDGFAEAWYLPNATDIPSSYARVGSLYDQFRSLSPHGGLWSPGSAVFEYANDQPATTLWYHDHTLGITRLNVYAGPAGFYLIRGGPTDLPAGLPAPPNFEIPIVIQDRSFNVDGSLFYPQDRAFFEGVAPSRLQIPFAPEAACGGPSDVAPIWNPEFFGNVMVVNGRAWPYLDVEKRRYRLRLLNGCNSRFLILRLSNGMPFWQIGADGGFLPQPVALTDLLLAPAERADVIVDFSSVPSGTAITLQNVGPDEPFGGGLPGVDFTPADLATTGTVMQFRVVPASGTDSSTEPDKLSLPPRVQLGAPQAGRRLSLNEEDSATVKVYSNRGITRLDCTGEPFGPRAALLGVVHGHDMPMPMMWGDPVSENVPLGATEIWELHNHTEDAHPIHIHQVMFEVVNRSPMSAPTLARSPEPWEGGAKDTVISYPDEITRVKAKFDIPGLFVWHCHILEHEDNEMMRPFSVG